MRVFLHTAISSRCWGWRMKRVLALILLLGTSAVGDIVRLNDGTRLEGQLSRAGNVWTLITADGATHQLDDSQIQSIQKTSAPIAPEASLASLRRELSGVSEPLRAIKAIQDFIAKHPSTPAATDAQTDLKIWQKRADAGLVRVGDDWLTPDQIAARKAESGPAIAQIRALVAAGKAGEADKQLTIALK